MPRGLTRSRRGSAGTRPDRARRYQVVVSTEAGLWDRMADEFGMAVSVTEAAPLVSFCEVHHSPSSTAIELGLG